jgi:hypothetical protein
MKLNFNRLLYVTAAFAAILAMPTEAWSLEKGGIVFQCSPDKLQVIREAMNKYIATFGWPDSYIKTELSETDNTLTFQLEVPGHSPGTLTLAKDPALKIQDIKEKFTKESGKVEEYILPSETEIVAGLMQRGRTHEFKGNACSFDSFKEHVAIRQNTVRMARAADWQYGGGYGRSNPKVWNMDWTVPYGKSSCDAIKDAFVGDFRYEIGCTRACKLISAAGPFLYYANKSPEWKGKMERLAAGAPLSMISPYYENGVRQSDGKFLERHLDVDWKNWIPGDWGWIRNEDPISSNVGGQEGSNIIYGGGDKFVVYYRNEQDRTFDRCVTRVYEWGSSKAPDPKTLNELRTRWMVPVRDFPTIRSTDPSHN